MLFHVYDDPKPEGYYSVEPVDFYRTMLDADWIIYTLLPILLIAVVALMMAAWRIHEIPTHRAHKKNMRQAELVTVLTLFGLFEHWVWAVALFIAYLDWEMVEDAVVRTLRRSRLPSEEAKPEKPAEPSVEQQT